MPLHILQLGPYPPPEGGVSRNMLAIRDDLEKGGDKCSIIATSKSSRVSEEPNVFHPGSPAELIRLARSIDFDVLHLHVGGDLNKRVLALIAAATAIAGRKSVLTIHSGAFPLSAAAKAARKASIRGLIFRRFGAVIAVNDDLADVFTKFGVDKNRIRKILPFSLALPDSTTKIPEEIDAFLREHSPVLLAVGGLEPDYDPLFQIDAMSHIVKDLPNAGLIIAGDGSMRGEVENASVSSPNILIAGNIAHAITLQLIERSDILLRTTLFDGDSISVREALFLGTPVIATKNGMRPEGVHLMDIGDRDKLTDLVREIAGNKVVRQQPLPDNSNIHAVIDLYRELI